MLNGFVEIRRNGKIAWVREPWADRIAAALIDGSGCARAGVGGRGELLEFPLESGTGIIRHFRRGGFVRHFLSDVYPADNRARKELTLHYALFQEGLPTPEPLGACWQRIGPFYRGWIATRRIEAVELGVLLLSAAKEEATQRCFECGSLIRRMHELGVDHPDLQLANILLADDREYLIDFDKAVRMHRLPDNARERNLRRLKRSFLKHDIPEDFFDALRQGYEAAASPVPRPE